MLCKLLLRTDRHKPKWQMRIPKAMVRTSLTAPHMMSINHPPHVAQPSTDDSPTSPRLSTASTTPHGSLRFDFSAILKTLSATLRCPHFPHIQCTYASASASVSTSAPMWHLQSSALCEASWRTHISVCVSFRINRHINHHISHACTLRLTSSSSSTTLFVCPSL